MLYQFAYSKFVLVPPGCLEEEEDDKEAIIAIYSGRGRSAYMARGRPEVEAAEAVEADAIVSDREAVAANRRNILGLLDKRFGKNIS